VEIDLFSRESTESRDQEMPPHGLRRSQQAQKPIYQYFSAFCAQQGKQAPNMFDDTDFQDPEPLLAYAASTDPDIMYFQEAMREPDNLQWIKAMQEEVQSHSDNENWLLVPQSQVPEGVPVLPAVCAMRRTRKISTREVYKWKVA
jgi:hypothetical protein